jgi:hypothetical protein
VCSSDLKNELLHVGFSFNVGEIRGILTHKKITIELSFQKMK